MTEYVFSVWSCDTAAICTHGFGSPFVPHGRPTGSPEESNPSGRTSPASSATAFAASRGDLPQPFARRDAPRRYTYRSVTGSNVYHSMNPSACSSVKISGSSWLRGEGRKSANQSSSDQPSDGSSPSYWAPRHGIGYADGGSTARR